MSKITRVLSVAAVSGILKSQKFSISLNNDYSPKALKKVSSILLVAILLLNVMGYYGVFLGLQYQNDVAMTRQLDSDQYDEGQTVTFKIPLTVAYVGDDADFKRVDGKFEHQGEFYRLVKQKYSNDTLTVVCFRDTQDKRIHQELTKYVKTFSDAPAEKGQNSKLTVSFIKDYISADFSIQTISAGWNEDVNKNSTSANFIPSFTSSIIHPPERA